jgi:hypothetical protein
MKTYYAILRTGNEKTGDSYFTFNRLTAAKHFAAKKLIPLKSWLKIYKVSK